MASSKKISDEELLQRVNNEISDALGYNDTLNAQRETAMEYYFGMPLGNEVDGRSQYVDS